MGLVSRRLGRPRARTEPAAHRRPPPRRGRGEALYGVGVLRADHGRPDGGHPRFRRAPPADPQTDLHRRGLVVSALQRARRRFRPGRPRHPGGTRRRRVGGVRAEGLEHPRPRGGPGHARGPDRSRGSEAQGTHLLRVGHAPPRRRRPSAPSDDRRSGVQRGVPDRGAGLRCRSRRRRWARAGGSR